MITLAILYIPDNGRPIKLVSTEDRGLLVAAADAAIRETQQRSHRTAGKDVVLAEIESAEAVRVKTVLLSLIPELRSDRSTAVAVM